MAPTTPLREPATSANCIDAVKMKNPHQKLIDGLRKQGRHEEADLLANSPLHLHISPSDPHELGQFRLVVGIGNAATKAISGRRLLTSLNTLALVIVLHEPGFGEIRQNVFATRRTATVYVPLSTDVWKLSDEGTRAAIVAEAAITGVTWIDDSILPKADKLQLATVIQDAVTASTGVALADQTLPADAILPGPRTDQGPERMIKLYKRVDGKLHYFEAWVDDKKQLLTHWGIVGTRGESKVTPLRAGLDSASALSKALKVPRSEGYAKFDEPRRLTVEYRVKGFGDARDKEKADAVFTVLNEALGWTGLGECDGTSEGRNSMEICCFVVDFAIGKRVAIDALAATPYADYSRIYDEDDPGQA